MIVIIYPKSFFSYYYATALRYICRIASDCFAKMNNKFMIQKHPCQGAFQLQGVRYEQA